MSSSERSIATVSMPEEEIDVLSALACHPDYRVEVIVEEDPSAYSLRIAQLLAIPTADDPLILTTLPFDLTVVIPDGRPELQAELEEILRSRPVTIRTVTEMRAELEMTEPERKVVDPEGEHRSWTLPLAEVLLEDESLPGGMDAESQDPPGLPEEPAYGTELTLERLPDEAECPLERVPDEAECLLERFPDEAASPVESPGSSSGPAFLLQPDEGGAPPSPENPPVREALQAAQSSLRTTLESLSLALDKQSLLRHLLRIAVNATNGDSGSIMLLDESGEHLRIAVAEGLSEEVLRRTRQKVGEGVAGNVLVEGRARILIGRLNDPRYRSGRERSAIKAAICVPIRVGERSIGVLSVSSDRQADAFDDAALRIAEQVCEEMAGILLKAIEIPDPADRTGSESLLRQVEGVMSLRKPLRSRLEAAAECLARAVDAAACRIWLRDPRGSRLERLAQYTTTGGEAGPASVPVDSGLLGWAFGLGRREALVPVASDGDRRGIVYHPIEAGRRPGLVEMEGLPVDEGGGYDRSDVVEEAVRRIGVRMEQERAAELEARRGRQMLELSDVTAALLSAENAGALVSTAAAAARDLFGADLAVVTASGARGHAVTELSPSGRPSVSAEVVLAFDRDLESAVKAHQGPVTTSDLPRELEARLASLRDVRWVAAVSLPGKDGPAGTISLYGIREDSVPPEGEDLTILAKFRGYLAQALARVSRPAEPEMPSGRMMPWPAFRDRVAEECRRWQRYSRKFVVTTVEFEEPEVAAVERGLPWVESAQEALVEFVCAEIREVDIPSGVRAGRIAILNPEANEHSGGLLPRLEERWKSWIPPAGRPADLSAMRLRLEQVRFPEDCRNAGELLERIQAGGGTENGEWSRAA